MRIAIVNDVRAAAEALRRVVNSLPDHTVAWTAADGVEAIAMAKRDRPDLILMDIQLPEISGLEVTKWLKEDPDLAPIPVIAVTAFAMKGDEEKIRKGGCEAYLAKPISVSRFLETVGHVLA